MTAMMPMSLDQIAKVIAVARANPELWLALKERELEIERLLKAAKEQGKRPDDSDVEFGPVLMPTLPMLVESLVKNCFGFHTNLFTSQAIIPIRREIRLDLGLPV